jgi:hypothetical protein
MCANAVFILFVFNRVINGLNQIMESAPIKFTPDIKLRVRTKFKKKSMYFCVYIPILDINIIIVL